MVPTVNQQSIVVFVYKTLWLCRLANSALFFVLSDCILKLSIFPCLEGLNKIFIFLLYNYRDFYSPFNDYLLIDLSMQ